MRILLSNWHDECFSMPSPVDGSDGPGDTDAQEDVDGVTSRHVADRRVGVLILGSSHFTGKHVCLSERRVEMFTDRVVRIQ